MSALSYAAANVIRLLPRARMGQLIGGLADQPWPEPVGRLVIEAYRRAYGISLDECERTSGFETFDAFFTRTLRPGVRPTDSNIEALVSPADGRLESLGRIEPGSTFRVKGMEYSAEELLGDPAEAERYRGGAFAVVYLSPRDYHRVHSPVSGTLKSVRSMPGDYFPVNEIGLKYVPKVFTRNRRVAMAIDSESAGRIGLVMVAAMVVGRITVSSVAGRDVPLGIHPVDRPVAKGEEVGVFHLGSTAVLFFEASHFDRWVVDSGSAVKVGERVAVAKSRRGAGA